MPRRTILSSATRTAGRAERYPDDVVRHDVVFPGFAAAKNGGRQTLGDEIRDTEERLDHLLEEKRQLERRRLEIQELRERQEIYRERRDKLVAGVLRSLSELQKLGHFELRRADSYARAKGVASGLRQGLEGLEGLEMREPRDRPALVDGWRRVRAAEREMDMEIGRLDGVEASAPDTGLFTKVAPERRSFLEWAGLGLSFFLPVLVIGLLGVIVVVAFVGVR